MSEIDKIIEPIKEWYGGGTEGERTNLEILADAIADLQDNRKELFVLQAENKELREANRHYLEVCNDNARLKEEMDRWNLSTKNIERDLSFEEENKRLKEEKADVFEIRIPNLKPDEVRYVRNQVNKFTQELLNLLTKQRRQRN